MPESSSSRPHRSPLLEQARQLMRAKHLSIRTEAAYLNWMERFLRFHRQLAGRWVHPSEMGNSEINAYLTHLAVEGQVAASTQNQAFSALLFLFREVLKTEFEVNAVCPLSSAWTRSGGCSIDFRQARCRCWAD